MTLKILKPAQRMGFIGGGNMAEAFIGALIRSEAVDPSALLVSDVDTKRLKKLKKIYSIETTTKNLRIFSECRVILFAVKPQQMDAVLSEIAEGLGPTHRQKKLLISIAAGIPLNTLERRLYAPLSETGKKRLPIIRVMPNTPAQVLKGISGMSPNRYATRNDIVTTRKILSSIGCVMEFAEKDLDAVTALSGSGPAYVFYFIEAMIEGGTRIGLGKQAARRLTLETFRGALALLDEQAASPEELRRRVTSPGGTTEAALEVMEQGRVGHFIIKAIGAARRRAQALSR